MADACRHEQFSADVAVNRLEDSGRFMADVRVKCAQCGTPFHFVGLPAGIDFASPRTSITGIELHAPIAPGELSILRRRSYVVQVPKD